LQRLLQGVGKFRREVYPNQREVYERAVRDGQHPHTLMLACADSRIDPILLTQSDPGEIFVARNIGNIVPAYGEMLGGVSAVIEYAVAALDVQNVVICGHTDCGAMKGLLDKKTVSGMPTVKTWLRNAEAALSIVQAKHPGLAPEAMIDELVETNVVLQLNHLRSHPSVAGKLAMGTLEVHGWIYDIATGMVRAYDEAEKRFAEIE
jgi:carbonic anhydrase